MKTLIISLLLLLSSCSQHSYRSLASNEAKKKVILFYSSLGAGHLSAANSLKAEILEQDPESKVVLKNIRDFLPEQAENMSNKFYMFMAKNNPNLLEYMYKDQNTKGNKSHTLTQVDAHYESEELLKYIEAESPDSIIATHYGSAHVLGDLREKGKLKDTPIGWLHTDYVEGYFPRISERVDKTFLPHKELVKTWQERGIKKEYVEVTGMPLNATLFDPVQKNEFMTGKGLSADKITIVIATGGEGIGDYEKVVNSLSKELDFPIQIIAITGKNSDNKKSLEALQSQLPEHVDLKIHGLVPQEELLNYIKTSNLYITKGGGLSPTEGFAIGKPMILMDLLGGHERENLEFFDKLDLAMRNNDQEQIGKDALKLLADDKQKRKMLAAQSSFRDQLNISRIADFALGDHSGFSEKQLDDIADFGVQRGTRATLTKEALKKLDQEFASDLEILLSDAMFFNDHYEEGTNPFGHLSLRVDDDVYTVNDHAVIGENELFHYKTSLDEYLFGIDSAEPHTLHGSQFGLSYARNTVGLRIKGATAAQKKKITEEFLAMEKLWQKGDICYEAQSNNCAKMVEQSLKKGGLDHKQRTYSSFVGQPLEVFDAYLKYFQQNSQFDVELVSYTKLPGSKNQYKYSKAPVSIYDPTTAFKYMINKNDTVYSELIQHRVELEARHNTNVKYVKLKKQNIEDEVSLVDALAKDVLDTEAGESLKELGHGCLKALKSFF